MICDHSNEGSLPVLTHDPICFSKFHKVKFGNLLSVKFGSGSLFVTENFWRHHHNHHRHHRYYIIITISTMIIFFVTTVKILGFPPPLQPSSMRHWRLASLGLRAQKTHFRSLFFGGREATTGNASAVRRPAWVTRTDFNIRHCVFSPNWSLPLSWFTVGFKSPSPLNLQHFVQRLSYNFLRLV